MKRTEMLRATTRLSVFMLRCPSSYPALRPCDSVCFTFTTCDAILRQKYLLCQGVESYVLVKFISFPFLCLRDTATKKHPSPARTNASSNRRFHSSSSSSDSDSSSSNSSGSSSSSSSSIKSPLSSGSGSSASVSDSTSSSADAK